MDHPTRFSAYLAQDGDPQPVIAQALRFTRRFLPQSGLDARGKVKLAIIVEELVSNSLRHGGMPRAACLMLVLSPGDAGVHLSIRDNGDPFDPTAPAPFDGPDPVSGGGVGLTIVRAWGEGISYERKDGSNSMTLLVR
ncbi:ATP-binding protein [Erythrobacter sp.]|jgi:anti-sigma regulatory factor (Ser/Thr protein kinase)|uniref:ATP-binding protein n=1 Tax=Erythrobacter sp. TaxID=1042 RepID=UPI002EC5FE55|nr:ATP-binding protein [Erythrobacter sp.]